MKETKYMIIGAFVCYMVICVILVCSGLVDLSEKVVISEPKEYRTLNSELNERIAKIDTTYLLEADAVCLSKIVDMKTSSNESLVSGEYRKFEFLNLAIKNDVLSKYLTVLDVCGIEDTELINSLVISSSLISDRIYDDIVNNYELGFSDPEEKKGITSYSLEYKNSKNMELYAVKALLDEVEGRYE